ncbi:MAG: LysM peptidoglycan-binding domain-containing protein [Anaerolineae bacterium]
MRRVLFFLLVLLFLFPAAVSAESPAFHTVAWGETLYSIARQVGISPQALAAANGLTLNSWVYAGQTLRIPGGNSSAPALSPAQTNPSGIYLVRAGDTLTGIAQQFGVSLDALAAANDIPSNGMVYIGWQLKIPGRTTKTTATATTALPETNAAYIVHPGDTLFGIALHYGVSMQSIALANSLPSYFVYAGQRLLIPNTSRGASTALAATPSGGLSVGVSGIPIYRQQQTLTCEEAAAAMALRGTLSEAQILQAMPRNDNPFAGIRGATNYPLYGGFSNYGTYAQGLSLGLAALGRSSTVLYGQGYGDFKNLVVDNLRAGKPVIWWTTWHQTFQAPRAVATSTGATVTLVPYEHTVVIIGATDWGIRYADPYDATYRSTTWANFERTSAYFGNMALVIQ